MIGLPPLPLKAPTSALWLLFNVSLRNSAESVPQHCYYIEVVRGCWICLYHTVVVLLIADVMLSIATNKRY